MILRSWLFLLMVGLLGCDAIDSPAAQPVESVVPPSPLPIAFQSAFRERQLRQAYLETIVFAELMRPDILDSIVYDPERDALTAREIEEVLPKYRESKAARNRLFTIYDSVRRDPQFEGVDNGDILQQVIVQLEPHLRKEVEVIVREQMPVWYRDFAATALFDGKTGRSSIFVFDEAFNDASRSRSGEATMRMVVRHELEHAIISADGARIGTLYISPDKLRTMPGALTALVHETLAYSRVVEKAWIHGRHSPEYLVAVERLAGFHAEVVTNTNSRYHISKLQVPSDHIPVRTVAVDYLQVMIKKHLLTLISGGG